VVKTVTQWPYTDRLAVLDLLRCIARFPSVAQFVDGQYGSVLDLATKYSIPSDAQPNENAAMMGARTIVNLFGTVDGRSLINSDADKPIAFLERVTGVKSGEAIGKFNRNLLIGITTAAVNLSVLVNKEKLLSPDQRRRLIIVLGAVLADQTDSEILYRGLVALGTLLATSRQEATGLDIGGWVRGAKDRGSEERVKSVANECLGLAS
jgi:phospholipase A-2-activating protein